MCVDDRERAALRVQLWCSLHVGGGVGRKILWKMSGARDICVLTSCASPENFIKMSVIQ